MELGRETENYRVSLPKFRNEKEIFNPVADRIKQHLKTFDEKNGKKQEGKKASAQSA